MSSDLTELYQQVILDHNRRPRNKGRLPTANRVAHGDNPTCGDQCHVYLRMEGDRIADISFEGSGCAISQASASLMTTQIKGKTAAEAEELYRQFHESSLRERSRRKSATWPHSPASMPFLPGSMMCAYCVRTSPAARMPLGQCTMNGSAAPPR